jgi:hypothetical protein
MKPNTIATFLAVFGLALIFITTLLLIFHVVPQENTSTLNLILGNALGWVTSTFAFFFGSSTGAKTKDDTIASLSATAAAGTGAGAPLPGSTTTTTTTTAQTAAAPLEPKEETP